MRDLVSKDVIDKLILLGIALSVFAADQLTKTWVRTNIPLGQARHVLGVFFSVSHIANTGAAFGLFPGQGTLFMIIAVIVIVLIIVYYRQLPMEERALKVSLGLQLGGALGNLMDRVLLGYVVDFIDFGFWPVFNLADCAVVAGVIILAYQVLDEEGAAEEDTPHHEAMEW